MSNLIDIILSEGQLEGTSASLAAWLVKEGDQVKLGDPIAELETDKVVMEVCATASGRVKKIITNLGDDVVTGQILGQIEVIQIEPDNKQASQSNISINQVELSESSASALFNKHARIVADNSEEPSKKGAEHPDSGHQHSINQDSGHQHLISPAVRRLLTENSLSIKAITGTGKRGRVTRDDVITHLNNSQARANTTATSNKVRTDEPPVYSVSPLAANPNRQGRPLKGKLIPHTKMRKSIASHMVESLLHTSPHVTSVFEMDMTNIIEHRKWHKKEYAALDVNLTFTAYFLAAMAKAVKLVPQSNARFHEETLEVFSDVNIGVGTALGDAGLVVPVVEHVQEMNLFEISQKLNIQTEKARTGKLRPADMSNGTITISNHGVSGSLFATPIIINQPEVAILGVGKLEKRVVVEDINGIDTMVIRPKCYVSLSIDHRALDAHQTNLFLSEFVSQIENWGQ